MKGSDNDVLIIGGGAAGCAAASELSHRGLRSVIVETADKLGGLAGSHCCKSTEHCERCDACLPIDVRRDALNATDVTVMTNSRIVDARTDDGIVVGIARPGGTEQMHFRSAIVAIGALPFDPALDPRLGYGSVPGVLSSLDVDRGVRDGTFNIADGASIAVIQCVGSRDANRGAPYCSKVCCKYAYQLARHLQSALSLDITFFHMDWRPLDGDLEALSRWKASGASVIRSRPAEVVERNGRPAVRYADPVDDVHERTFDAVMLTVGLLPSPENERLASLLGVSLDDLGFFLPAHGKVLAAGCCTGPKDIDESVKEGIAAAGRAMSIMEGR